MATISGHQRQLSLKLGLADNYLDGGLHGAYRPVMVNQSHSARTVLADVLVKIASAVSPPR